MDKYADLIGVPFEYGGRGPEAYDCYGLVKKLHHDDGIILPDYKSPTEGASITALMMSETRLWEECPIAPGRTLLFRVPGNLHVGYLISSDRFIHTWERSGGVTIERFSDWKSRLMGCYKYVGKNND